jgi:hypothetical protein
LAILRTTLVLPECNQHTAPLALAVGRIALQVLQVGDAAVEIGAQLLHLRVDGDALLRLTAEECEEAAPLTALSPRLRADAVEVHLLAVDQVLKPPDVRGPARIAIAAIDRTKLRFEAQADRVAATGTGTARRTIRTAARVGPLCGRRPIHKNADEKTAHEPAGERERQQAGGGSAP